jgi:predicted  nucleic acid-binding Zn-ribbon protein
MLTKADKKYINEILANNNKILIKEMIGLFNATNERIDQTNERIDKVLDQLKDHDSDIDNHERRINKLEEKVFVTTT